MKRVIAFLTIGLLAASTTAWGQSATPYPVDNGGGAAMPASPPAVEQVPLSAAPPADAPTMDRFQQTLSPYGRWVTTPEYGTIWVPNASGDPTWRPYTNGRWVYTDQGWTFVSADPWGWAPFHYGRWLYYPAYGWSWIPGYQWGPAWVSWRYGGGYMAWAPLGPMGVSVAYYNTPSLWIAVNGPAFYRPLVRSYFVPTYRIGGVFASTTFVGVPRVGIYYSPPVSYVSRVIGAPVTRVMSNVVAPRWVSRGVFRPNVTRIINRAPVVARPNGWVRPGFTRPSFNRTTWRPSFRPGYSPAGRPGIYRPPYSRPSFSRPGYTPARPGGFARPYSRPSYRAPSFKAPSSSRRSYTYRAKRR